MMINILIILVLCLVLVILTISMLSPVPASQGIVVCIMALIVGLFKVLGVTPTQGKIKDISDIIFENKRDKNDKGGT